MSRNSAVVFLLAGIAIGVLPSQALAYHRPKSGRFLSRDPIGVSGGLHVYRFVSNNPIGLVDPTGLINHAPGDNNDPDSTTVSAGLGTLCTKECECRCKCDTPASKSTTQSSPKSEKERQECLKKCKKG